MRKPRRSCNLHKDCDEADELVRAAGGRITEDYTGYLIKVMTALHDLCSLKTK